MLTVHSAFTLPDIALTFPEESKDIIVDLVKKHILFNNNNNNIKDQTIYALAVSLHHGHQLSVSYSYSTVDTSSEVFKARRDKLEVIHALPKDHKEVEIVSAVNKLRDDQDVELDIDFSTLNHGAAKKPRKNNKHAAKALPQHIRERTADDF